MINMTYSSYIISSELHKTNNMSINSTVAQTMDEKKWRYYLRTGDRTVEIVKDRIDDVDHVVGKMYTVHYKRDEEIDEEVVYMGMIKSVEKFTKRNLKTQGWYPRIIPDRHRGNFVRNKMANFVLKREKLVPGDTASFIVVDWFFAFSIGKDGKETPIDISIPKDDTLINIE